ncbi:MAG: SIS domain-containing protein, partial [Solirubrobacterales bacterium]
WGPEGPPDGLAKSLARAMHGTVPVMTGAGLTTPIAYRWKTQINENAKLVAFFSELPEANHNEICGWGTDTQAAGLAAVLLEDVDQHPRVRRRFELTAKAIEAAGAKAVRVETVGENHVERLFWTVMLGDLVSLALADARGVDPLPIEAIDALKAALGRPQS